MRDRRLDRIQRESSTEYPQRVVSRAEMVAIERASEALGVSTQALMEVAGRAVADVVRDLFAPFGGEIRPRAFIVAGPGNNGADGMVCARHLADWGFLTSVYLASPRPPTDPRLLQLRTRRVTLFDISSDQSLTIFHSLLATADVVVDAIFGIGRLRPVEGQMADLISVINRRGDRREGGPLVVAVDVPSGLDADSGSLQTASVEADITVALGHPKRGHFLPPGITAVGRLVVRDIGLPIGANSTDDAGPADELITRYFVSRILPTRPLISHKGTFGKALVVSGSRGYSGAPALSALGALRVGAGLVTIASAASVVPTLQARLIEPTFAALPEDPVTGGIAEAAADRLLDQAFLPGGLSSYRALAVGPGLGRANSTKSFLLRLLAGISVRARDANPSSRAPSVVVDADGLNLLASDFQGASPEIRWWDALPPGSVLTPHPGEMSRLLRASGAENVRALALLDRIELVRQAARLWGAIVVLKGACTVIGWPAGSVRISPFATPVLAAAGSGDVLTGIIAGLIAQGLMPFDAAAAGVYLHGALGERLESLVGSSGVLSFELTEQLPQLLSDLRS